MYLQNCWGLGEPSSLHFSPAELYILVSGGVKTQHLLIDAHGIDLSSDTSPTPNSMELAHPASGRKEETSIQSEGALLYRAYL